MDSSPETWLQDHVDVPAIHPDSVHAPAWKSRHVQLTLKRGIYGWLAVAELYHFNPNRQQAVYTANDVRTYTYEWRFNDALNRDEMVSLLAESCMVLAYQARGLTHPDPHYLLSADPPEGNPWVAGTTGLISTISGTRLHGWLTGKGHNSRKPNEQRLFSEELLPLNPALPGDLLAHLSYLTEQHAR